VGGMAGSGGSQGGDAPGGYQVAWAGRDGIVAGRDVVYNDYRRGSGARAVPDPAAVALPGPVRRLPRPAARVFEGRRAALGALGRALANRGGPLAAQAVFGLGGTGKSELALQYAHARSAD
jgi:hypothetical protein